MQIDQFLVSDTVSILTPTERVARDLRGRRAFLKRSSGAVQYDDPAFIGTLRQYCSNQWESLFDGRQLLHQEQLLTLCKQAIDNSGAADGVISTMSMARKMRQAERFIREYNVGIDRESYVFGAELSAFYNWHQILCDRLERSDYVTEYELPALLSDALSRGEWAPSETVVLYGFIELTPAELMFIESLQAAGVDVHVCSADRGKSRILSHEAASQEEEVSDAACWLRHQIKSVPAGRKPPRCALIVPNLDRHRSLVRQVLDRDLAPNSLLAGATPHEVENIPWYAFAGGSYLAELPWIRSVMDLLGVTSGENNVEDLSRLLVGFTSPLDHGLHFEAAALDLKLRERHGWKLKGGAFAELLGKSKHVGFRRLAQSLKTFFRDSEGARPPSAWADRFEAFIRDAGYLNPDRLVRAELHQWQAFQDALDVLRSLDAQMGELPFMPVYRWLDEICHTRRYSHDKSSAAPVQVLAPEEAYGLSFDRAWLLAVDAQNFPGPVEPNPFLAVNAQVKAGIPSASSELNAERSQKLIDDLMRCSAGVICSVHSSAGGTPSLKSGLVHWEGIESLDMESFRDARSAGKVRLSATRKPDRFPAVTDKERERLRSGVSIFADFAQDELSAALIHRLNIRALPAVSAGLTSSVQGNLVHDALNLFWSKVRTSERLHGLAPAKLKEKVSDAVTQAMTESGDISEARYGANLLALERFRISDLVLSWLEFEKQRAEPFEVIVAEGVTKAAIEGLEFEVRIDRIDRVYCRDGSQKSVIIDYKTGRIVDMRALNSSILTAPQLPIYATFSDLKRFGVDRADGVSLAKVFAGELAMHVRSCFTQDLTHSAAGATDVSSEQAWVGQLEAWRNRLTDNAKGFLAGDAMLSYRPHEYLGSHAHLAPLMRLGES